MPLVECEATIEQVREGLRRVSPRYLLRHYDVTLEEYDHVIDEDFRCEFLDGVLIVHSPASMRHEEMTAFLITLLSNHAAARRLGRVYGSNAVMRLGNRRLCPDVCYLAGGSLVRIRDGVVVGPVDLAVEVISKSTRSYDLEEKRPAYREAAVPEIWFFDYERKQCEADFLEGDRYTSLSLTTGRLASRVLPGLVIDVEWLWAEPLPNPLDCLRASAPET